MDLIGIIKSISGHLYMEKLLAVAANSGKGN